MGLLPLKTLTKEKRVSFNFKRINLGTSFLLGIAFGAGWTPCVGPVLSSVLVLAASSETVSTGVALLGTYSLGLAMPFLGAAAAMDALLPIFKSMNKYLPWISRISGAILALLGILLFFDMLAIFT